jgi:nucleoside-diphosphate-sugar epimerase
MNKTVLITGASGTVARAVGKHLCEEGFRVIGTSRSVSEDDPSYTDTFQGDLLKNEDLEELEEILQDVDAVFHLAWNVVVENFDTHEAWKGNLEMYRNVLTASKKAGVPVFVNGSSIHACTGSIPAYTVDADLEDTPEPYRSSIDPDSEFEMRRENPEKLLDPRSEDPDSPYGWSKIVTERILRRETRDGSFDLGVSIRIGGVNPQDRREIEGEPYYPSLYWSHRDLGRTLEHIIKSDTEERQGYHQFYGVSDNPGRIFSIENSFIGE